MLRGGSWNNNSRNLRAANRNDDDNDNPNNNIGFRVCRGSHIVISPERGRKPQQPETPADHGGPGEARA